MKKFEGNERQSTVVFATGRIICFRPSQRSSHKKIRYRLRIHWVTVESGEVNLEGCTAGRNYVRVSINARDTPLRPSSSLPI